MGEIGVFCACDDINETMYMRRCARDEVHETMYTSSLQGWGEILFAYPFLTFRPEALIVILPIMPLKTVPHLYDMNRVDTRIIIFHQKGISIAMHYIDIGKLTTK